MKHFLKDAFFLVLLALVLLIATPFTEKESDFATPAASSTELIDGITAVDLPLEDETRPRNL